jgi:hypothetical protein
MFAKRGIDANELREKNKANEDPCGRGVRELTLSG